MDDSHSNESGYINVELQAPSPREGLLDFALGGSPISDYSELYYDPSDFDGPHGQPLLMFDQFYRTPSPVNSDDVPSSASHSPSMPVFDALSFASPAWHTDPLPDPLRQPSPPRLLIDHSQPGIVVNAPDDSADHGPHLQIVPATPVTALADGPVPSASSWIAAPVPSASSSRSPSPAISAATTPAPSRSPSASPRPQPSPYLYPQPLPVRSRSKSEASLEPPAWDTVPQQQQQQQLHPFPAPFAPNFTFGAQSDFLSPNNGYASSLRRSRSDSANPRHRNARSEDLQIEPYSTPLLFPPSPHDDFIRHQQLQRQPFLSPAAVPPQPHPLPTQQRTHYRTASAGARPRSERGATAAWDPTALDLPPSARPSPYPSPHASPRGRILPLDREEPFDFSSSLQQDPPPIPDETGALQITVSKPNVTTGRTANASQRRRKQEATFVCPVPGCGSTFTRSFNLKGHIRSHNEEKPFQCKWPGCGKGFARQHDCKRHEQLHTNYRPFTCEGCGKQFARMDALNRHLRSEGGADCARQHDGTPPASGSGSATPNEPSASASASAPSATYSPGIRKIEESFPWGVSRLGVAL